MFNIRRLRAGCPRGLRREGCAALYFHQRQHRSPRITIHHKTASAIVLFTCLASQCPHRPPLYTMRSMEEQTTAVTNRSLRTIRTVTQLTAAGLDTCLQGSRSSNSLPTPRSSHLNSSPLSSRNFPPRPPYTLRSAMPYLLQPRTALPLPH